MTQYDLDEATRQLGKLIHRAGKGESIAIVAKDGVVARLVVESAEGDHPRSVHDHEWFDRIRIKPRYPANSVETLRAMRAEYRY